MYKMENDGNNLLIRTMLIKFKGGHMSKLVSRVHSRNAQSNRMQSAKEKKNSYKINDRNKRSHNKGNKQSRGKEKDNKHNKISVYKVVVIISIIILVIELLPSNKSFADSNAIQEGIANEIIRFHVIANSDKEEDQQLKLKVKDKVVTSMRGILDDTKSKDEAREKILENMDIIKEIAEDVIKENGYEYSVKVSLSNSYFPTKVYGDMTFPPGVYEALKIEIGVAEGKNWWCVMFPPLCFVDATYSIVPDESKEQLRDILTMDEYNSIANEGKVTVKVKFKFLEIIQSFFS